MLYTRESLKSPRRWSGAHARTTVTPQPPARPPRHAPPPPPSPDPDRQRPQLSDTSLAAPPGYRVIYPCFIPTPCFPKACSRQPVSQRQTDHKPWAAFPASPPPSDPRLSTLVGNKENINFTPRWFPARQCYCPCHVDVMESPQGRTHPPPPPQVRHNGRKLYSPRYKPQHV